jgi:hypothetical protein
MAFTINEIGNVALPLFAFYLLIFCNFTANIIGCRLQELLVNSMLAKHIISLMLLFFLIVLVNPDLQGKDLPILFGFSVAIYIWFILTTHSPIYIIIIVLILLLSSYIIGTLKSNYSKDKKQEKLVNTLQFVQNILAIVALSFSVIGFVIYTFEKRMEYDKDFSWITYLAGTTTCKRYTPKYAKIIN